MRNITEEIQRLTSVLQALTQQRVLALQSGNASQALSIQSVLVDIDNKIQELEKSIWSN